MNCDDCSVLLGGPLAWTDAEQRAQLIEHLLVCADCRDVLTALDALHAVREVPVRPPTSGAIARAMHAAMAEERARPIGLTGFWTGLTVGATAAGIIAVFSLTLFAPVNPPEALIPQVTMALHQPGRVSIGIESDQALQGAEIHVSLRGAIDLEGYEGQRDIRWATDLERGMNELTLPVVALSQGGGQLIVEVYHGDKNKTFLVDVRAQGSDDAA
jgi:hypothetical protein